MRSEALSTPSPKPGPEEPPHGPRRHAQAGCLSPAAAEAEHLAVARADAGGPAAALEDTCSVLDLPPEAKHDSTIERIARGARPLSTEPEKDLLLILMRALFARLIADGDMHLKNLALLKIASPGAATFQSVRIAPLYDAVTTRVFPGLEHDRTALKLNARMTASAAPTSFAWQRLPECPRMPPLTQ